MSGDSSLWIFSDEFKIILTRQRQITPLTESPNSVISVKWRRTESIELILMLFWDQVLCVFFSRDTQIITTVPSAEDTSHLSLFQITIKLALDSLHDKSTRTCSMPTNMQTAITNSTETHNWPVNKRSCLQIQTSSFWVNNRAARAYEHTYHLFHKEKTFLTSWNFVLSLSLSKKRWKHPPTALHNAWKSPDQNKTWTVVT